MKISSSLSGEKDETTVVVMFADWHRAPFKDGYAPFFVKYKIGYFHCLHYINSIQNQNKSAVGGMPRMQTIMKRC